MTAPFRLFLCSWLFLCLLSGCEREEALLIREAAEVERIVAEVDAAAADKDAYRAALLQNERRTYQSYLDRFPEGQFRQEVEQHVANIDNREAQAKYAYELAMRLLRQTGAPPIVRSSIFGNFRPAIDNTLKKTDQNFKKELDRLRRQAPNDLPNAYLDHLRRRLRDSRLYTEEVDRRFRDHKSSVDRKAPSFMIFSSPLSGMAKDHLRLSNRAAQQMKERFRRQGIRAVEGIEQYRIKE